MIRFLSVLFGLAIVAGCAKPAPLPAVPRVLSFAASPSTLEAPGKVTLTWQTQDATQVEIRNADGVALPGVDNAGAGAIEVEVTADTLFVLSARNERGVQDVAIAPVSMVASARSLTFVVTPPRISAGQEAVLAWSAPGAKTLTLIPEGGAALDLHGQLTSGTVRVSPSRTTRYELTAGALKRSVTLTVGPSIPELSATPAAAKPGEKLTVSWKTLGASKVTLTNGTGQVLATETNLESVRSGSASIDIPVATSPTAVFTYVLVAEAEGAPATQRELNVYVAGQPRFSLLKVPEYGRKGGTFTVSWKTVEADVVRVLVGGAAIYETPNAAIAAEGSLDLPTPVASQAYTIAAVNLRGGNTAQTKTVSPVAKTALTGFAAGPNGGISTGGSPATLTWDVPGARALTIRAAGQYTVFTQKGPSAEKGTLTVYPNENTEYTLEADNTLGDTVSGKTSVAVTTPAVLTPPSGALLQGNTVPLSFALGTNATVQGLSHFDIAATTGSTGFVDIKGTGTKLEFANVEDATQSFQLPADFETWLFGTRASGVVSASINGFFAFAQFVQTRPIDESLPSAAVEPLFVAPFWDDLSLGTQGGVYFQVVGEAPEKTLIVQWDDVKLKGDATSSLTFQAQLHQTGVITYEYKTVTVTGSPAVTIGVQGPITSQGLSYPNGVPSSGSRLTFFGPKSSPVSPVLQTKGPYLGWVKLGAAYLKLSYTATALVTPNELVFSEALYAPNPAIAATGEWLEVFNATSAPLDLAGWTLDFGGGSTHVLSAANGTTVVPANGLLLLGQSKVPAENDGVAVQYVYGKQMVLPDANATVRLSTGSFAISGTWAPGQGDVGVSATADPGQFLQKGDSTSTVPHPLICSSKKPFGTQMPQQKGSPGKHDSCFGYALSSRPVSYRDISTTGTALVDSNHNGDEDMIPVDLTSAPFKHFGLATNKLSVGTNGLLGFRELTCSPGACFYTNRPVPEPNIEPYGILAPFWDDLDHSEVGANIFSERIAPGADPANPGGHWIIQWHKSRHFFATGESLNFQVKLFDDGAIEIHYGAMVGSNLDATMGATTTVWLEDPTGTQARVISVNQRGIQPNSAYRFTPL